MSALNEYRASIAAMRIAAAAIDSGLQLDSRESTVLKIAALRFEAALKDRRDLMRQVRRRDPNSVVLKRIEEGGRW